MLRRGGGLVIRILATVTPCGPCSPFNIQVVTPRVASRCGRMTTSLVIGGLDQLVKGGPEGAGDRG